MWSGCVVSAHRYPIFYISLRQEQGVLKDTLTIEPVQAGHVAQGRKELKDEQLFARLIGAAVLLALAVIILPFVLDGSGSQREYEYAETLPAEPPRPVVESSFSSRQPVQRPGAAGMQVPARSEVDVSLSDPTPTTGLQPSQQTATGASAEPLRQNTEQLASAVANAAAGNSRSASSGTPAARLPASPATSLQTRDLQTGWNIQVASFVRDSNAVTLINRLRNQSLPAYANRVQGSQRTVVRVLVGPFDNQVEALALQNRIDRDYRVESLVVRGR